MELEIEKLVYGGDGLARLTPAGERRGKAVFVPFTLPGERVEAIALEERSGFLRGRAEKLLKPSDKRIEPHCPYFLRCGGCHYQHTNYENQLEIKTEILRETLRRTGQLDWQQEIVVHPSPEWNYRNRTRMRLREQPFALGYYKFGSHELLPVSECPISSPTINRAIRAIWQLGDKGIFTGSGIGEVEFFVDHDDSRMLLEFYTREPPNPSEANELYAAVRDAAPEITSAAWFEAGADIAPGHISGSGWLDYPVNIYSYRVGAGSFFQTNRFLTGTLLEQVTSGRSGKLALDLYSGVGLFAVPLARYFENVIAVEASPSSFADLKHNAPANVHVHQATTEQFLKASSLRGAPELIVVDPPRAGLGEWVAHELVRIGALRLTYVSCDPATAARDLRVLIAGGYRLEALHFMDLFPQTFHIESIFQLVR
jgi:23S rRNA (uracil1939-C5)-methyltransferase